MSRKLFFFVLFFFGCVGNFSKGADISNICYNKRLPLDTFMNIHIDNSFSETEKKHIQTSFETWQSAIHNMIDFSFQNVIINQDESMKWDCDRKPTVYNGCNEDWRQLAQRAKTVGGVNYTATKDIFIFCANNDLFQKIALHESGHMFIQHHSTDKEDIMFHRATDSKTLSKHDREQACFYVAYDLYPHNLDYITSCVEE